MLFFLHKHYYIKKSISFLIAGVVKFSPCLLRDSYLWIPIYGQLCCKKMIHETQECQRMNCYVHPIKIQGDFSAIKWLLCSCETAVSEVWDNLTSTSPWNHPKVMTELVKALAKPLSYLKGHGNHRDTSDEWSKVNITFISKNGQVIHPRNCRLVSCTSVPWRNLLWNVLSVCGAECGDGDSSGFMKGESCLTCLISFWGETPWSVNQGRAADIEP